MFELAIANAEFSAPNAIENYDVLKAEIKSSIEHYNYLVVTEDAIRDAKSDRAKLNKLKKAISDQRIAAKNKCYEFCSQFEAQCKSLEYMTDEPVQAIDKQIKAFENAEKERKYQDLQDYFNSIECRPEWLELDRIISPKWANKTVSLDLLKKGIDAEIKRINSDLEKLNEVYDEYVSKVAIIAKYKETLDFESTTWYGIEIVQQEMKMREAEKRVQNAQKEPSQPESIILPQEEQTAITSKSEQPESVLMGIFKVECTKTQLIALRNYMKSHGIKFEVVKF